MSVKTRPFDAVRYLDDDATRAAYLSAALETCDTGLIAEALGTLARSRGMTTVATETGLARESLYRALSSTGNPELATVLGVMKALGLKLSAAPS